MTGNYNNNFHLIDLKDMSNTQYEINYKKETISRPMGQKIGKVPSKLDFLRKTIALDFHPKENLFAVASLNCFITYSMKASSWSYFNYFIDFLFNKSSQTNGCLHSISSGFQETSGSIPHYRITFPGVLVSCCCLQRRTWSKVKFILNSVLVSGPDHIGIKMSDDSS